MDLAVAGRESESAEVSLPVMVSLPVFDPSPTHLGYVASEPEYVGRMVQHDDLVPIDPAVGCRVDYSTSDFEFPIQETNREEPEPRRPDFELIYDPSSESVGRIETGGEVEGVYVTGPVEHVGHILPRVDIPIMPKPPVKDRYHRLLHGSDDPEY